MKLFLGMSHSNAKQMTQQELGLNFEQVSICLGFTII